MIFCRSLPNYDNFYFWEPCKCEKGFIILYFKMFGLFHVYLFVHSILMHEADNVFFVTFPYTLFWIVSRSLVLIEFCMFSWICTGYSLCFHTLNCCYRLYFQLMTSVFVSYDLGSCISKRCYFRLLMGSWCINVSYGVMEHVFSHAICNSKNEEHLRILFLCFSFYIFAMLHHKKLFLWSTTHIFRSHLEFVFCFHFV